MEQAEQELPTTPKEMLVGEASSRQRSSSPWVYTIRGQLRSNQGSGVSTPVGHGSRRVASLGGSSGAATRASWESALLQVVRKQLDTFRDTVDEKVNSQISKLQTHNERMMESKFSRLEEKVAAYERDLPEIKRCVSGLTGNFQGLSEESSRQIRRVDSMDERVMEFKRHIEQDSREKLSDFQQQINKFNSTSKVMYVHLEDLQKQQHARLERLELSTDDTCKGFEEIHAAFMGLCSRMEAIEDRCQDASSTTSSQIRGQRESREELENTSALLTVFERRMGDMSAKINQAEQDSSQLHSDSKSHEEQLKGLRSLLDAREEKFRAFMDKERARMDVEARLEQITRRLEEDSLQTQEKVEKAIKRLESQEQAMEEMRDRQVGFIGFANSATETAPLDLVDASGGVEDYISQFGTTDARLCKLEERIEEQIVRSQADSDLGAKVGTVVKQLEEVIIKVNDSEKLEELREDVETLKTSVAAAGNREESVTQQTTAILETLRMLQGEQAANKEEMNTMVATVDEKIQAQTDTIQTFAAGHAKLQSLESEIVLLKDRTVGMSDSERYEALRGEFCSNIKQVKDECSTTIDVLRGEVKDLKCQASAVSSMQDDEEEQLREQKLLGRIDELCRHIEAVENAVSKTVPITLSD